MGDTISAANLRAKIWPSDIWVESMAEIFFKQFSGKEQPLATSVEAEAFNNIICMKEDLLSPGTKHKGYQITMPLAYKLTGSGVTGDSTLEGSEEAIDTYDFTTTVEQKRNAVRQTGLNDEYKVTYDARMLQKALLKMWLKELMDSDMITALSNSPTYSATWASNRHLYAAAQTTVAGLDDATKDTGDLFDLRIVRKVRRLASKSKPKIRPIIGKGKKYYVILADSSQIRSLHESTDWQSAYQLAAERGEGNPIFSGADSVIDGVVIHEYDGIKTAAAGQELANDSASGSNTATADVARAIFMGAQAGLYAIAKRPFWVEKFFDYGNKFGVATGLIYKAAKCNWNSIDYGTVALDTMIETD